MMNYVFQFRNKLYRIDNWEYDCKSGDVDVESTCLGEKEMYEYWFERWSLPSGLYEKTNEMKNCDIVEEKLNDEGLNVYVHRHTLFDIKCYVVTERSEGSKTFFNDDLAEILDIPKEWINLSKADDPQECYILEDEFNKKYCNEDGLVEFKSNLQKYWDEGKIHSIKKYFAELFHISKDDVFIHYSGGEFIEINLPKSPFRYDVDFRFTSLNKDSNTIIIKKEWL